MPIRSDTESALDGQTDGQNWYNSIAFCMHCMLTRDNKKAVTKQNTQDIRFYNYDIRFCV